MRRRSPARDSGQRRRDEIGESLVRADVCQSRGRWLASGVAAGAAVLYHAPTALPVLAAGALVMRRERVVAFAPIAAAILVLLIAGRGQEQQHLFERIPPAQEALQRMRAAYVYVSAWPVTTIARHVAIFAGLVVA